MHRLPTACDTMPWSGDPKIYNQARLALEMDEDNPDLSLQELSGVLNQMTFGECVMDQSSKCFQPHAGMPTGSQIKPGSGLR